MTNSYRKRTQPACSAFKQYTMVTFHKKEFPVSCDGTSNLKTTIHPCFGMDQNTTEILETSDVAQPQWSPWNFIAGVQRILEMIAPFCSYHKTSW